MSTLFAILIAASLATPEASRSAELERLQLLVNEGQLDEAQRGYQAIAGADPKDLESRIALARIYRWTGRTLASRSVAAEAVALAPDRSDARAELAWSSASAGLPMRARDELGAAALPPNDLRERLTALQRPAVTVSSVLSDDSNGVSRLATRLTADFALPEDARLVLGAGESHLAQGDSRLDHRLLGLSATLPLDRLRLSGTYVLHQGTGTIAHEVSGSLGLQIWDGYAIALGVRHRPFIETADSLATDDRAFYGAGAGGALQPDQLQWLSVDEVKLSVQLAPVSSLFSYGEGRVFRTGDSNQGWSAAGGIGLNLVRLVSAPWPVELYLRWDAYLTGFANQMPTYFSPSFQDGQSPGLDLRLHLGDRVLLGAEGGRTFALFSDARGGWFGGGQLQLQFARFTAAVHGQIRDDPWYGSRRLWISLRTEL